MLGCNLDHGWDRGFLELPVSVRSLRGFGNITREIPTCTLELVLISTLEIE